MVAQTLTLSQCDAEKFLEEFFGIKGAFITDLSELKDFFPRGLPEGEYDTPEIMYRAWDEWVIQAIKDKYGVEIEDTMILLLDLLKRIDKE